MIRSLFCGVACAVAVLAFWILTAAANYGGNWTALFCTGGLLPPSPLVAREHIYLFPGSNGFDGQIYHIVAHDPFLRTDLSHWVDAPRFRYSRILVPGLAWLFALGRDGRIDACYRAVVLLFSFLGGWWMSLASFRAGASRWWGLGFLAVPATVISADRLTIDIALAALAAGFVLTDEPPAWVLVLAPLVRETGVLFPVAAAIAAAVRHQWVRSVQLLAALLPWAAWVAYVRSRTSDYQFPVTAVPGISIAAALLHPSHYTAWPRWERPIQALDLATLVGFVLSFALVIYQERRQWREPWALLAALFALAALALQRGEVWENVYGYARILSPALVVLFVRGWRLPVWLTVPRLFAQLTPQLLGIAEFTRLLHH